MKVLTPSSELSFPVRRNDALLHRVLRTGEAYLVTEASASTFEQRIRSGLTAATLTEPGPPPFTFVPERVLVFFSGEVGDAVCVEPALRRRAARNEGPGSIDFVTANADACLFPPECAVFEYPITVRQAGWYDSWVEFDARRDVFTDPCEAFGNALGLEVVGPLQLAGANRYRRFLEPLESLLVETGRPRVAVNIYCDSHYRSWRGDHACATMGKLVEAGFDCYIIGNAKRKLVFQMPDGRMTDLWVGGIYDASGLFGNVEELVAFLWSMDAVIAPDGGILQLACAMSKPTVGLFGPTRGEHRKKYAPYLRPLDGEKDCAPCWCVGDRPPCEGEWCEAMTAFEPERIVETVQEMLAAKGDQ